MGGALGRAEPGIVPGEGVVMATTIQNATARGTKVLESYLGGKWQSGTGQVSTLVNPVDGSKLATASSEGLDLKTALEYARRTGGAELRKLTYAQRAELLGKVADVLAARREEWFEIARKNSGNTKADAAIDVDGSIGTLKYFAKVGAKLGSAKMLRSGAAMRLAKDANFQGVHLGVPLTGVAVHINAFNFPAWGMWEKAAVALLAGVPVLTKPATSTAWLAQEMVQRSDRSGHSAAGNPLDSVRLGGRPAESFAIGRCSRLHGFGGHRS